MKINSCKLIQYIACIVLLLNCSSAEVKTSKDVLVDFTPIKDDLLAEKFIPKLIKSKEFGNPFAIYYRASTDKLGKLFITYHFIWEKEENNSSGIGPFFSRNIYTGGLKLQKIMFGKADIELVSFIIDKDKIIQIEYETAENYDPSKFSVKHKHIELNKIPSEFCFNVISWNHLFQLEENCSSKELVNLKPKYFSQELWKEYTMTKDKTGFFSRNRAHKKYELEFVE